MGPLSSPEIKLAGTTTDAAAWGLAWLQASQGWLLILDNVTEPADIVPVLAQLTGGHILITTRRDTGWGEIADPIRLDILDPSPAAALLTERTRQGDRETAALIAAELGYLPIALHQAAAYVTASQITLAAYLQLLRDHPTDMYATSAGPAQQTVARTWDISLAAIQLRDPAAVSLLRILACYAPDLVPRVMLGGRDDPDRVVTNKALAVLASYSLVTLTADDVSMHRLVQAVLRSSRTKQSSSAFGDDSPPDKAVIWLYNAIRTDPHAEVDRLGILRALVPHAAHLAADFPIADAFQKVTLVLAQSALGRYLNSEGLHGQALKLTSWALEVTEAALGPEHRVTGDRLRDLAITYNGLGRHADALPLAERALAITEANVGPQHPMTSDRLRHLAATYNGLARHADALPLAERALAITEADVGPQHPMTSDRLRELAASYNGLGRHADALPLAERALAITEGALDPHDLFTAVALNDLASTYRDLERYAEALPLQERSLAITEAVCGPDHPDTAHALNGLALIYTGLGRHCEARPLQERALAITEAALGPDHPQAAWIQRNMAAPPMTASFTLRHGASPASGSHPAKQG